jgi:hypothetical protein
LSPLGSIFAQVPFGPARPLGVPHGTIAMMSHSVEGGGEGSAWKSSRFNRGWFSAQPEKDYDRMVKTLGQALTQGIRDA